MSSVPTPLRNLLIIVLRAAAALVNALIAILELIRQFID
ncbi:TPA: DinQ-like type I toxin DqlB [Escherichia coli]